MISLKNIKMKKIEDFLATKEAVKEARVDLERKTEKALWDSVYNRIKACELSHIIILD
jgi:hypothetical protein